MPTNKARTSDNAQQQNASNKIGIAVCGTACTVCERSVNTKIGDKHL